MGAIATTKRQDYRVVGPTVRATVLLVGISTIVSIFTTRLILSTCGLETYIQYSLLKFTRDLLSFVIQGSPLPLSR